MSCAFFKQNVCQQRKSFPAHEPKSQRQISLDFSSAPCLSCPRLKMKKLLHHLWSHQRERRVSWGLGLLRTPRTGRESDTKRLPAPRNRDECPGINKSVPQPSMVGKGATFWGKDCKYIYIVHIYTSPRGNNF